MFFLRVGSDLLALLDKGVELCNAFERQVVHQINLVRICHEPIFEGLDVGCLVWCGAM